VRDSHPEYPWLSYQCGKLRFTSFYGSDAPAIRKLITEDATLGRQLDSQLPYVEAEVVWAARAEMARTVEDVLARRTRALFLNAKAAMRMAPRVANILAGELGKDEKWQSDQVKMFNQTASGYLVLSETATREDN
jgi:glycerol-3-phosphate dehydrogenase